MKNSDLRAVERALTMLPERCPLCGAREFVRSGKRKVREGIRQIFRCKSCYRRFSHTAPNRLRNPPEAVLDALAMVCMNYTYTDIMYALHKRHGVDVSKSAISKWVSAFEPPYLAIRRLNTGFRTIVRSSLFTHSGVNYHYKVHLPKLATCPHKGLRRYLEWVPHGLDSSLFNRTQKEENAEAAMRCSKLKLVSNPGLKVYKDSPLSKQASRALMLASHSRKRHAVIEEFFLMCDRNTVAIEIPVYMFYRGLGLVTGHIDILQWNFGKIHILDYKPDAEKENPEKVVTQLTLYALALRQRCGIPLSEIVCGYFDHKFLFQFRPRDINSDLSEVRHEH